MLTHTVAERRKHNTMGEDNWNPYLLVSLDTPSYENVFFFFVDFNLGPFALISYNYEKNIIFCIFFYKFLRFSGKSWKLRIVLRIPDTLLWWHYDIITYRILVGKEKIKSEAFYFCKDNVIYGLLNQEPCQLNKEKLGSYRKHYKVI